MQKLQYDLAWNSNAFALTFAFAPSHTGNASKVKRECKPTHTIVQTFVQTLTDTARNVNRFGQTFSLTSEGIASLEKSGDAHNKKINANFLFGGFIASYESWCVIKQLCFVSTVMCKLPQIKNFVYPLCVALFDLEYILFIYTFEEIYNNENSLSQTRR